MDVHRPRKRDCRNMYKIIIWFNHTYSRKSEYYKVWVISSWTLCVIDPSNRFLGWRIGLGNRIGWNHKPWWHHQMETFSALLAICAGISPVPGVFPTQWPVRRSFDVFFDLRLNKRLSKQSWGWWFETLLRPLWRYCNTSASRWMVSSNMWWVTID